MVAETAAAVVEIAIKVDSLSDLFWCDNATETESKDGSVAPHALASQAASLRGFADRKTGGSVVQNDIC